jgi:S-disulfanyl-L-cysteine oxidoreductase SoxD
MRTSSVSGSKRANPLLVRRGGRDAKKNDAKPSSMERTGWLLMLKRFSKATTLSAPTLVASRHFLDGAATPPHEEGTTSRSRICLLIVTIFLLLSLAIRTVWDGVYNEEQARRGQAAFLEQCSNCHGRDLEGADMTPPLTGGAFTANWDGLTIGDLADRIRISMPLNSPGTLSRQQTTDVVAYILRFNQFPAGKEELPREQPAQKQILFKARP